MVGKTIFFTVVVTITTNGTAASYILATLPITAAGGTFYTTGSEYATGVLTYGRIDSADYAKTRIYKNDGTYPGGNSYVIGLSGSYSA